MTAIIDAFTHKRALITGGSSGIGLSLAKILVASGANICILGRRKPLLLSACADLESLRIYDDQWIEWIEADVSSLEDLGIRLTNWINARGAPDLLINSAGVSRPGLFLELPIEIFDEMMSINYYGTVNTIRIILPKMLQLGYGHIVNISSVAGFLGMYGYTAYAASKFAVRGYSDSLRAELLSTGVGITIVFPQDTNTPQLEAEETFKPPVMKILGVNSRVVEPEFVATKILHAVTRKKYICTPGFEATIFYNLSNILGKFAYPLMDLLVKDAYKKLRGK